MPLAVFALSLHAILSASPEDAFGDPPPPPPPLVEDAPFDPADPAEDPSLVPPPDEELRDAPPPVPPDEEPRDEADERRDEERYDDGDPLPGGVDPLLAGAITGAGTLIAAVPTAAACAVCPVCACPAPVCCVPLGSSAAAVGGMLFAGAGFDQVLFPALAAGGVSAAAGAGGIVTGFVLLVALSNAAQVDVLTGLNPNFTSQGASLLAMFILGGSSLACMSVGAAGAGALVYWLAGSSDEAGDDGTLVDTGRPFRERSLAPRLARGGAGPGGSPASMAY